MARGGSLRYRGNRWCGVLALIFVAITALAAGLQGWLFKKTTALERGLLVLAGALVIIPVNSLDAVGVALFGFVLFLQFARRKPVPALP